MAPQDRPYPSKSAANRGGLLAGMAGIMLAAGLAGVAFAADPVRTDPPQAVLLLTPGPVAKLQAEGPVAVKGTVAEIFGNKFILQDDSGRALVDLGPRGDEGTAVTKGEAVTVQGLFDRGFLHAQVLVRADGRAEAFGPPRPPRPDRERPRPGARAERGPDRGPPPPRADRPPPPVASDAPPPPAVAPR